MPTTPLSPRHRALAGEDVSAFALYAAAHEQPYLPVDPETLADVPGGMPLDFGEPFPDWLLSRNGTTLVHIEHGVPVTIAVSDGPGGDERLPFQPPVPVFSQRLSRDGTRLVT